MRAALLPAAALLLAAVARGVQVVVWVREAVGAHATDEGYARVDGYLAMVLRSVAVPARRGVRLLLEGDTVEARWPEGVYLQHPNIYALQYVRDVGGELRTCGAEPAWTSGGMDAVMRRRCMM